MSKRLISSILLISLLLGTPAIILGASQPKFKVILDDETVSLENQVYINEKGQIMCPLREIAEKLRYKVNWNNKDKSINMSKESDIIKLKIGENNVNVNGENMKLKSHPIVNSDKTFVTVEFLDNALNLIIGWDSKQQILRINQPKENNETYFSMTKDKGIADELDAYMKALEKHQNFHGSVLVAKEGKVLLNQGYGFADLKENTQNKPQTRFAIGSMTKQFTAMAIMQLNEKDLLNVEDKVSKYLPDLPNGDLITIHNLLTHTSGLVNYTNLNEFLGLDLDNKDPMVAVNLIKDMPLEFKPGEEFRYSNTNYVLLGIIIEKVTGMAFEDYLEKNIFTPLNMMNTGICYGKNNELHHATPYIGYLEVVPIDDKLVLTQTYGAGNMYSTVEDLYRWDRALKTEKLVKKETMDKIFKEHIAVPQVGSYGYGWMIADTDIGKKVFHNGNTMGFTSNIARYSDEDLVVIILTNNGYYNTEALTDTLTSIAFNKDYEMPEVLEEIKIKDPNLYDSYVGKYEFLNGTYMDIFKKDNRLYAQVTGQDAFEIFPQTNSKFFAKSVDARFEFIVNDKEVATELVFEQLGVKLNFKKVEDVEKEPITIDPIIYDDYVGEYELAPSIIIKITKEDNGIFVQLTGQDKFEIFPLSETEYFYKVVNAKITFEKDDKGKITSLTLHQNGQDIPANKIK